MRGEVIAALRADFFWWVVLVNHDCSKFLGCGVGYFCNLILNVISNF